MRLIGNSGNIQNYIHKIKILVQHVAFVKRVMVDINIYYTYNLIHSGFNALFFIKYNLVTELYFVRKQALYKIGFRY